MNIEIAEKVIRELVKKGVRSFCLCPGGRPAPFVELLSRAKGLELLYFFEERSAGFFALGRARRDERAVAVLTTSGTAVAELLPSVIEAYYSGLPLVLVTADRPLEFGGHGAPQTLKKALGILEDYCSVSKNIVKAEDVSLSDWSPSKGSLHLNVCFDEPLLDQKAGVLDFSNLAESSFSIYPQAEWDEEVSQMEKFFQTCKKPLVLVGELRAEEQEPLKKLLSSYKGLLYTEPLSNLEGLSGALLSGENILKQALRAKEIDGVIRLGGIPRVRFWRDLEKHEIPVLNLSSPPYYRGLSRFSLNAPLLPGLDRLKDFLSSLKEYGASLRDLDQKQVQKWKEILLKHPQSEDFWFWTLKKSLKPHSKVFLGNSSPIRLWDMSAFEIKKDLLVTGQAGVQGIEGLLSRFLGECSIQRRNVGIAGDLSLLYDMAGFWKSKELSPWTFIVINNSGGRIFSRLFKNPAFLNAHELSFAPLAKLWALGYECYKNPSDFRWPDKPYSLLEICPDLEQSKNCFKQYLSLWELS